ncbi:MAG: DUF4926 domain-containing protein [Chloroherpetonaceae bacterium]
MLNVLDVVALNEDLRASHYESKLPILLKRGQVGTVLEVYEQGASYLVEFADQQGVMFALEILESKQLIPLHHQCFIEST